MLTLLQFLCDSKAIDNWIETLVAILRWLA